jgi:hypothetical protein
MDNSTDHTSWGDITEDVAHKGKVANDDALAFAFSQRILDLDNCSMSLPKESLLYF